MVLAPAATIVALAVRADVDAMNLVVVAKHKHAGVFALHWRRREAERHPRQTQDEQASQTHYLHLLAGLPAVHLPAEPGS